MPSLTTKKPSYLNSKYNAIKHGILSRKAILEWESKEEFDNLCVQLTNQFNPQTPMEKLYLADLINTIWRKQRIIRAEKTLYESSYNDERIEGLEKEIKDFEYCLELVSGAENIDEIMDKIPKNIKKTEGYNLNSLENFKFYINSKVNSLRSSLNCQIKENNKSITGINYLNSEQQQKLIRYEQHLDKKIERLMKILK